MNCANAPGSCLPSMSLQIETAASSAQCEAARVAPPPEILPGLVGPAAPAPDASQQTHRAV